MCRSGVFVRITLCSCSVEGHEHFIVYNGDFTFCLYIFNYLLYIFYKFVFLSLFIFFRIYILTYLYFYHMKTIRRVRDALGIRVGAPPSKEGTRAFWV